jgi:hypothetical protein
MKLARNLQEALATRTPDPEKLERERIQGNEIRRKYWEQRDRQKDLPSTSPLVE